MIASDRGILRTLDQTFYGDEENGFAPNKQFVYEMTENYPEVWQIAKKIEGLVCRLGEHAGGVIFVDEDFENSTALMRAPNGDIMTQFDLHDCEDCSLIKYDLLSVEAMDKIHICLDLLMEQGYIEQKETLKDTYESVIGIYNLEREAPDMWKMVWNHEIQSLFQMEKQSGIQGIALTHPQSVDDLAVLNSVIRLMAQEKGAEQPLNKFARFKNDIQLWYDEMDEYGLTKKEQKLLEPVVKLSYGISESQEKFMQLVQMPECGGFDLTWADKLRKSIAKKNPAAYEELQKEYFETVEKKGLSKNLCNYVWNVLVATSRGYGFNASHTLAYSLIALQEMNLAYKYPIMFWNCACLISDSGGAESDDEYDNDPNQEEYYEEVEYDSMEDFGAEGEDDEDEDEDEETVSITSKKKKKTKSANYGKIATAIGKIKSSGVDVAPPDINKSSFTFYPDVESNTIRYGLSGITKVGEDLVKAIMDGRPYTSVADLTSRVKINKAQVINLIKSGAFDSFGDRVQIMRQYINSISDTKQRITLQNMKMLIDFDLIPDEYDMQRRVYNFNKYVKKLKWETYYALDNIAFNFYEKHFDMDNLIPSEMSESGFLIKQTVWDKIYQSHMDKIRPWVKENSATLLEEVNNRLTSDMWNKYCQGNLSKWEMDAISFYSHEHELANVNARAYDITDFDKIPETPVVGRIIPIKGRQIPIFKLWRIAGTVIDRDKSKKTVTLLTTNGVVTVKIFGPIFTHYDKQISQRGADGKKHVVEASWFKRGTKIIITGLKQSDGFLAKKYTKTPYSLVEKITSISKDGLLEIQKERIGVED